MHLHVVGHMTVELSQAFYSEERSVRKQLITEEQQAAHRSLVGQCWTFEQLRPHERPPALSQ